MSGFPQGCTPISEATAVPKSEAVQAQQLDRRGIRTTKAKGRYWMHAGGLFWQPVHWLARLPAAEVEKPHRMCLGFASTVRAEDEGGVQGRMPLHLLSGADLDAYDIATLPAKRRNQLRKAWKTVEIVQVIDAGPHLRRLYDVTCSAISRFRGGRPPDYERLAAGLTRRLREDGDLLTAGFVNGVLAGYFLVSCVDDVAYIDQVMLATEYLSTDIGTVLTYETVMVLKRQRRVRHAVYGMHSVEKPPLTRFKEGMGFKVVTFELTGMDILMGLEFTTENAPEIHDLYIQVSGMSFQYDPSKPLGEKIDWILIGDLPIDLSAVYTITANSGVVSMLGMAELEPQNLQDTGRTEYHVLRDFIVENSPIAYQVEGRIVESWRPSETVAGLGADAASPQNLILCWNSPNPFENATSITYSLPTDGRVRLEIFNHAGQRVATLADEWQVGGEKTLQWEAQSFPNGVYYRRLAVGDFADTGTMILSR